VNNFEQSGTTSKNRGGRERKLTPQITERVKETNGRLGIG